MSKKKDESPGVERDQHGNVKNPTKKTDDHTQKRDAHKAKVQPPPEPTAKMLDMSSDEIVAELEELEKQRQKIKEKGRQLGAALFIRQEAENAAYHGLTVEAYRKAKESARDGKETLQKALGGARKVQVAKVKAADLGIKVKGLR